MATKGKLKKNLSLRDRISIIQDYDKIGGQKGVLAALHDCTEGQISFIIKNKQKYLKHWVHLSGITLGSKSQQIVIAAVVYEWIKRYRTRGFSISYNQIRKVAEEVSILIKCDKFQATDAWMNQLKKRYKLNNVGPLLPKKYKIKSRQCDLKKILLEFKEHGPPSHLKRRFLNDIDLSHLNTRRYKKRNKSNNLKNNKVLQNSVSELSDGYVTNSTESNDFIAAMQIDDDENAPIFENQSPIGEETKDTIGVIEIKKKEEPAKTQKSTAKTLSSYKEAVEYLRPLQNFALMQEDVRAIKRISKLESLFAEEVLSMIK